MHKKSKRVLFTIHVLVAIAFKEHIPNGNVLVVDHINNIKTDNRATNLRIVTNRENCSKRIKSYSSKFIGVSWDKARKMWVSAIQIKGKHRHLGHFDDEEEASKAYQKALKELCTET